MKYVTLTILLSNSPGDCCVSVCCNFSLSDGGASGDRVFILVHDPASQETTMTVHVTCFNAITLTQIRNTCRWSANGCRKVARSNDRDTIHWIDNDQYGCFVE